MLNHSLFLDSLTKKIDDKETKLTQAMNKMREEHQENSAKKQDIREMRENRVSDH